MLDHVHFNRKQRDSDWRFLMMVNLSCTSVYALESPWRADINNKKNHSHQQNKPPLLRLSCIEPVRGEKETSSFVSVGEGCERLWL
jgi:hypothetical protein